MRHWRLVTSWFLTISLLALNTRLAQGSQCTAGQQTVQGPEVVRQAEESLATAADGTHGFRINGRSVGDRLAHSCDGGGDVNGDGIEDFVIGTPRDVTNPNQKGEVLVLFGGHDFPASIDRTNLNGINGFYIEEPSVTTDDFALIVRMGDVNNDTIADILVTNKNKPAYVIFGKNYSAGDTFGSSFDVSTLDGSDGFTITGSGGNFGAAAGVGKDVNGDGIDDIYIAGTTAGGAGGAVYVIFGRNGNWPSTVDASTLHSGDGSQGFEVRNRGGSNSDQFAGSNMHGDVNNDGVYDLIIQSHRSNGDRGEVHVIFGQNATNPFAPLIYSDEIDLVYHGVTVSSQDDFLVIGGAGFDINNDGIHDFVLTGRNSRSYVIFGSKTLGGPAPTLSGSLPASVGFVFTSNDGGDPYLAVGADINLDGVDDLLIGAPKAGSNSAGGVYVIFGGQDFSSGLDKADLTGEKGFLLVGDSASDDTGGRDVSVSDFNNDGAKDVMVTAFHADPGAVTSAGSVFVWYNTPRHQCVNCTAGTYSGAPGATICSNCPAGKYSATERAMVCSDCEAGTYSAVEGANTSAVCENCPAGTYSSAQGVNALVACKTCPNGWLSKAGSVAVEDCIGATPREEIFQSTSTVNILKLSSCFKLMTDEFREDMDRFFLSNRMYYEAGKFLRCFNTSAEPLRDGRMQPNCLDIRGGPLIRADGMPEQ